MRALLSIALIGLVVTSHLAAADAWREDRAPRAGFDSGVSQPLAAPPGMSVEKVYRLLYARLDDCFSPPYSLKPLFYRAEGRAELLLVSGFGLNTLAILDSLVARVEIQGVATDRGRQTLITLILTNPELGVMHELLARWLEGDTRCMP